MNNNASVTPEERAIQLQYLQLRADVLHMGKENGEIVEMLRNHSCLEFKRWAKGGIFLLTPSGKPEVLPPPSTSL